MIQLGNPIQPVFCDRLKNAELKSRLRHQEGSTIKSKITRDNDTLEFTWSAIKYYFENKEEIRNGSLEGGHS